MDARRPSKLWIGAAVTAGLLALGLAGAAWTAQRAATTPIGEGELFVRDARRALGILEQDQAPDVVVREIRNDLRIEAVSYVDGEGIIAASTSPTLKGHVLANGVLSFGFAANRFVAVAAPIAHDIMIDGITEWTTGDVLYRVLQPTASGALLLDYDISELLARRSQSQNIAEDTVRLSLAALLLALIAVAAVVGRSRTARHNREVGREAALLRYHADELERGNAQLEAAKLRAEEALELAEEKNRVRAEFVLMINHELRTPLTAVVTGAELLRTNRDLDAPTRAEILDTMVRDGTRLEEMIDQMLAVARIENRGLNVEFAAVDGPQLCASLVAADAELTSVPSIGIVPRARTDKTTLGQLIRSLVNNARTHGARHVSLECRGAVPFEAQLEVGERPANATVFIVADDGPGITESFLPRIFEKYEKDSFSPGTGLGLYLARMMIEALGGSIAVETSSDGTRMAISVPRTEQTLSEAKSS